MEKKTFSTPTPPLRKLGELAAGRGKQGSGVCVKGSDTQKYRSRAEGSALSQPEPQHSGKHPKH